MKASPFRGYKPVCLCWSCLSQLRLSTLKAKASEAECLVMGEVKTMNAFPIEHWGLLGKCEYTVLISSAICPCLLLHPHLPLFHLQLFIEQMFTEHLLPAMCWAAHWRYAANTPDPAPCSYRAASGSGEGWGREIQKRKPRITILKAGDHTQEDCDTRMCRRV